MGIDLTAILEKLPAAGGNKTGAHIEDGRGLNQLDRERQEREHARNMYAEYQKNIKRSEALRAGILKGLREREDPRALLLKAVECISLMTGETVIYSQAKEDLNNLYGYEEPAARIEL